VPPQQSLDVDQITSESEFLGLEEAWNDVARASYPHSLFLRHEWFAAAWSWRRCDAQLHLLLAHRNGRIVGILPLIRRVERPFGVVRYELLTVPDSQLADLVCASENVEAVARAFAAALASDGTWDLLLLDLLQPDGPCATSFIGELRRQQLSATARDCGRNFFIDLSADWSDYYESRSRSLKKAMNLAANRMHAAGEVRIQCIGAETRDHAVLAAALETTVDISARSWKRDTGNSLDQPGPQAFIRSISQSAIKQGWLSIWLLYLDEKPLAMEYDLTFDGNVHALRADFDADCNKISPGAHLFHAQIERLFSRGLNRYYMGLGENAYKLRWTNEAESLQAVIAYNRTPKGHFERLRTEVLKPALRKARDRVWAAKQATAEEQSK
jgi:CelD/BcsL family acetyltransferase involved in cellulose biosynthesis